MTAAYAYTPEIWPPILTIILLIALAAYAFRQRQVRGAVPFAIGSLIGVLWAFGAGMEAAAVTDAGRITWLKLQAVSQLPSITAVALFILDYVWPGRYLTRRNVLLFCIPPLLLLAVVLTDPLHHLMWRGFATNGEVLPIRAPVGWAFIAYAYLLGLLEMGAFVWLFVRSRLHRWPVAIMLAGQIAARIIYLADQRLDLYAITIPLVTYGVALFGFRILDANAVARETAISGMRDAMLVLDPSRHVASVNPAAEGILGMKESEVRGHEVDRLLPGRPALATVLTAADAGSAEIRLGAGTRASDYQLTHTRLEDFRGLHTGDLFLLHDITEVRRAQRQMLEQQSALAALQEREQLARELHDSIGQVLGYAGLQTDTAGMLLEQGQTAETGLVLDRLASVLREAHADVRQQIMDLRATPSPQAPFPDVVRQTLDGYAANYGIATALQVGDGPPDSPLAPEAQAQLYRILQEALTNIRRHSGARRVQVTLASGADKLEMTIADDGRGFDVDLAPAGEGHFGLATMRERAAALGGSLKVASAPGSGTLVAVTIPRREA